MFFLNHKAAFSTLSMKDAAKELSIDSSICLLDVRTQEEYQAGHIPGSINLSLDSILEIARLIPDKGTRLFVYCLSGTRSQTACTQLHRLKYFNISNIGGIAQWNGKIERGKFA